MAPTAQPSGSPKTNPLASHRWWALHTFPTNSLLLKWSGINFCCLHSRTLMWDERKTRGSKSRAMAGREEGRDHRCGWNPSPCYCPGMWRSSVREKFPTALLCTDTEGLALICQKNINLTRDSMHVEKSWQVWPLLCGFLHIPTRDVHCGTV